MSAGTLALKSRSIVSQTNATQRFMHIRTDATPEMILQGFLTGYLWTAERSKRAS